MEVKGTSSQVIADLYKTINTQSKEESPSTVIEIGLEVAKEQKEERAFSRGMLEKQMDSMNELLAFNNTAIKFNLHEDLGRMYVQIVNRDTEEVVKEIPPEKFLDMVASMLKNVGLLIDKKV